MDIFNYSQHLKKQDDNNLSEFLKSNSNEFLNDEFEIKENTLIISEIDKIVILPYTIKKLNEILNANPDKFNSLEDVIRTNYVYNIRFFKNGPIARFREAFKLAREREFLSIKQSLDLAFECFFKSDLHPAIITSCKNLNQLDIYLSCLEYDELEDFKFFDIVFKIPPMLTKKEKAF